MSTKPIDFKAAKERLSRKKHADKVLRAFDDLQHADERTREEARAEVERKARNKF